MEEAKEEYKQDRQCRILLLLLLEALQLQRSFGLLNE